MLLKPHSVQQSISVATNVLFHLIVYGQFNCAAWLATLHQFENTLHDVKKFEMGAFSVDITPHFADSEVCTYVLDSTLLSIIAAYIQELVTQHPR